ncbi:MAG: type II toxin-antitoxin system HicA family toxin [bacterium]
MAKNKKPNKGKITPVKPRILIRIFERVDYEVSAKTKRHVVMRKSGKYCNLAIPNHPSKEVHVGIINQLIDNAGITRDEYLSILTNL